MMTCGTRLSEICRVGVFFFSVFYFDLCVCVGGEAGGGGGDGEGG